MNKNCSGSIDFLCKAIIKISQLKNYFEFEGFNDEFISKLIEASFLEEQKEFILKFCEKIDIGKSVFLPKIMEFLKVLGLK